MEIRVFAKTDEEMAYMESAIFALLNMAGISPSDIRQSEVVECAEGYELLIVFREGSVRKFQNFYGLRDPERDPEKETYIQVTLH